MDTAVLEAYVRSLRDRLGVPECAVLVTREHETVFSLSCGAVPGRDLSWLYSLTKLFTVVCVLRLWEAGHLCLDAPVSQYLPEYAWLTVREGNAARPARRVMTLRHLLTMTSGIAYDFREPALRALRESKAGDNREIARALAAVPLRFDPGERFLYGFSCDVLAAVCEVVTGESFGALLRDTVLQPLGAGDGTFFPDGGERARLQAQYTYDYHTRTFLNAGWDNTARLTDRHQSGGGGLCASGATCALLTDALACGGTAANGNRLLREETVRLMRRNQLGSVQLRDFAAIGTVKPGYGYGFGVRTLLDPACSPGPTGEFGWSGAGGSYVLMDPVRHISLVYIQNVLNFMPAFDEIHNGLRDRLYEALGA